MSRAKTMILIRRAYEPPAAGDGVRILVDRLWPRGVTKEALALDHWARDLAPSNELRKWYHADMTQFAEFRRRYRAELAGQGAALAELHTLIGNGPATLLTASATPDVSHAVVLKELLER